MNGKMSICFYGLTAQQTNHKNVLHLSKKTKQPNKRDKDRENEIEER